MNLPLLNAPATAVPDHKQKELTLTLMELLINAARENKIVPRANGGEDELTRSSPLTVFSGKLSSTFVSLHRTKCSITKKASDASTGWWIEPASWVFNRSP